MIELWAEKVSVFKGYWNVCVYFKFYSSNKGKVKKVKVEVYGDNGHAFLWKDKKFTEEEQKELETRAIIIARDVVPDSVVAKWIGGEVK